LASAAPAAPFLRKALAVPQQIACSDAKPLDRSDYERDLAFAIHRSKVLDSRIDYIGL
jgi:hypothetical protein